MPVSYDKFVLKAAKSNGSPAVAAFMKLSPNSVSANTVIGESECLAYFPRGYKNASETGETTPIPAEQQPKKRKRKRKAKTDADGGDEKAPDDAGAQQDNDGEQDVEDTTEQDDDEEDENSLDENETENAIDPMEST